MLSIQMSFVIFFFVTMRKDILFALLKQILFSFIVLLVEDHI